MTKNKCVKELVNLIQYTQGLKTGRVKPSPTETLGVLSRYLRALSSFAKLAPHQNITMGLVFDGRKSDVHILQDSGHIFHYLFLNVDISGTQAGVERYLKESHTFLADTRISLNIKVQLIDFENRYLALHQNGILPDYSESTNSIESRLHICLEAISEDTGRFKEKPEVIRNLTKAYLLKIREWFIHRGQLVQAYEYFLYLLNKADDTDTRRHIILIIINHTLSFGIISNEEFGVLLEEHKQLLNAEELKRFQRANESPPVKIEFKDLRITHGEISQKVIRERELLTRISFSISANFIAPERRSEKFNDGVLISVSPIHEFWSDPIFRRLSSMSLGEISWAYFCDQSPETKTPYSHVMIILNGLFCPDIIINEEGYELIDFKEKEALIGRAYLPVKERAVRLLREYSDFLINNLDIDRNDLDLNLFSNFTVDYIDRRTGKVIHSIMHAITNPDGFIHTANKYNECVQMANLCDEEQSIRQLISETEITSSTILSGILAKLINIVAKANIEHDGGYRYLWGADSMGKPRPRKETDAQPYILGLLKHLLNAMGIQISREVPTANGAVDFLASYTNKQNKLLSVCVELKLAQSANIEHGVTTQLPQYMKGERCKFGIYVFLWFKCEDFPEPSSYNKPSDLEEYLKEQNINQRIEIVGINCTKPTVPSRKAKGVERKI